MVAWARIHRALSVLFSCFCAVTVIIGLANDWNALDMGGPFFEIPVFLLSSIMLFLNEGYQVGILGVRYFTAKQLEKFPQTHKIRRLIFSDSYDRLPRLFLGQSFLVVATTFLISGTTTFSKWPLDYCGLPDWAVTVFFKSGLPGIVLCVNVFQLLPSIFAQRYPREFLQSVPAIYSTISASLFIESLGILHFTFAIVDFLERILPTHTAWERGTGQFGSFPSKFSSVSTESSGSAKSNESDILYIDQKTEPLASADRIRSQRQRGESSLQEGRTVMNVIQVNQQLNDSAIMFNSDEVSISNGKDTSIVQIRSSASSSSSHGSSRSNASSSQRVAAYDPPPNIDQSAFPEKDNNDPINDCWVTTEDEGQGTSSSDAQQAQTTVKLLEQPDSYIAANSPTQPAQALSVTDPMKPKKFLCKVIVSGILWLASGVYMLYSLIDNRSQLQSIHPALLIFMLIIVYVIVWYCEGLKIAIVGTGHCSREDLIARGYSPVLHDVMVERAGSTAAGIPQFMLGRQLIVVPCGFLLANMLSFPSYADKLGAVMFSIIVSFSLPTVLFSIMPTQLAPQIFAGKHTEYLLRVPGGSYLVRAAIILSALGITHAADVFAEAVASGVGLRAAHDNKPSDNSAGDGGSGGITRSMGTTAGLDHNRADVPVRTPTPAKAAEMMVANEPFGLNMSERAALGTEKAYAVYTPQLPREQVEDMELGIELGLVDEWVRVESTEVTPVMKHGKSSSVRSQDSSSSGKSSHGSSKSSKL